MMKPPLFYFIVRVLPCQGKEKEACKMVTIATDHMASREVHNCAEQLGCKARHGNAAGNNAG